MLKNDVLQQLSQLKESIRAQKDFAQGIVRGTQGRFGFVVLDDGREAFLSPDAMQRVFPGDRVEVSLTRNEKDKLNAELERLLRSDFVTFTGRYVVRGQGHFVTTDTPYLSRWIFLPPKERGKGKEGDYVQARVTRHPFKFEGKAQARIESRIGGQADIGIEHSYIVAKHGFPTTWGKDVQTQAAEISRASVEAGEKRRDYTHMPFITIDAATTQDMDDALYIESDGEGWNLFVAIADPTHSIAADSPLGRVARERGNTLYLPGNSLTMLPEALSHDTFSLVPEQNRPALICRMVISDTGEVRDFEFSQGIIRSRSKLSYEDVTAYLQADTSARDNTLDGEIGAQLAALSACSEKRNRYRAERALLMDEQPDYELILNDKKKIERIEKRRRTVAHRIVEEAMLATNCCAGQHLAEHGCGLFSSHAGFREERLKDIHTLLKEHPLLAGAELPEKPEDLADLSHYCKLIKTLQQHADAAAGQLLSTLKRMLQPGELTREARPHLGLGFTHYATVTSPIRRYQDFYNHLAIKSVWENQAPGVLGDAELQALKDQLAKGRQACRQLEQWLICQYMADKKDSVHAGKIVLVNSQGLGVRLNDTGVEGFVLLNKKNRTQKLSFDQNHLTLVFGGERFVLDQPVTVRVAGVDMERRQIKFELRMENQSGPPTVTSQ